MCTMYLVLVDRQVVLTLKITPRICFYLHDMDEDIEAHNMQLIQAELVEKFRYA